MCVGWAKFEHRHRDHGQFLRKKSRALNDHLQEGVVKDLRGGERAIEKSEHKKGKLSRDESAFRKRKKGTKDSKRKKEHSGLESRGKQTSKSPPYSGKST